METRKLKNTTYLAYCGMNIVLGASITAVMLYLILTIYSVLTGTELIGTMGLTVKLIPQAPNSMVLTNEGIAFNKVYAEMQILKKSKSIFWLADILPILELVTWTLVIYFLRKVVKNVYERNHFVSENLKSMRRIAYIVMIIPHVIIYLENTLISSLPQSIVINGMKVGKILHGIINIFNFSLSHVYILAGLLILMLAEVFKAGKVIQQKNDLTVWGKNERE